MIVKFLALLFFTLLLGGCVVEDPKKKDESVFVRGSGSLTYTGVASAIPESQKKIRIYFPGHDRPVNYLVYMNGNFITPVATLSHDTLVENPNGLYSVVIDHLEPGTKYFFSVRVRDSSDETIEDYNFLQQSATTFSEFMPTFSGVLAVENLAGVDGLTKLRVKWNEAITSTGAFISGYTIFYRKVSDVNFQTYRLENASAREAVITGLVKNTPYIVGVRAFDSANIEDKNAEYSKMRTLDDSLVIFPGISGAQVPTNSGGFSNILISWPKAIGAVYKYRIFWDQAPGPANILTSLKPPIDVTDLRDTSRLVGNLLRNTQYVFAVVGCLDANCLTYVSASTTQTLKAWTTPPVAPFSGVTEAKFGIDFVTLSWLSMPDESKGAHETFTVVRVNASGTEIGPLLPPFLTGNPVVFPYPVDRSATEVRVNGLTDGQKYCFKVKSTVNDAVLRYSSNSSFICGFPQYVRPGQPTWLAQSVDDPESTNPEDKINTPCYNPTTNGFTVKWKAPADQGTFSCIALYAQNGSSVSYTAPVTCLPKQADGSTYSYTFANTLLSDNLYTLGLRTVYYPDPQNPSSVRFGANSELTSCKTNFVPLVPEGWFSLMALGSKTNGLNNNAIIPESFLEKGKYIVNRDGNGTPMAIAAPFTMPVDFNKMQEYIGFSPIGSKISTYDSRGMIRLAWKDFTFQGSNATQPCNQRYFSACQTAPSLGYNVYRMNYVHGNPAPTRPPKNSLLWGSPRNSVPIKAKSVSVIGGSAIIAEFYDYDFQIIPGVNNQAKAYWYKIEPVANGSQISLDSADPDSAYKDYVVKMIIPPNNTALIHRWMANEETCKRMGRTVDRNNQYRCLYNGIATKGYPASSPTAYYYDVSAHIVMDRFEISCNFSRNRCNNTESKFFTYAPNGDHIPYESSNGDCIGFSAIPYGVESSLYTTLEGAVHYNRRKADDVSCRIFSGGSWKDINDVSATIGSAAITNAANMPPLTRVPQAKMNALCKTQTINLVDNTLTGGVPTVLKQYTKRLQRKQEFVLAAAPPQDSALDHSTNFYEGGHSSGLGCNIKYAYGTPLPVYKGMVTWTGVENLDNDLDSNFPPQTTGDDFTKHNAGYHGQKINRLDLRSFRYPTTTIWDAAKYNHPDWDPPESIYDNTDWTQVRNGSKAGPVFASGSQGTDSTMMCLSRYGIQDLVGNMPEWSSDVFKCTNITNCLPRGDTDDERKNLAWSYTSAKGEIYNMASTTASMGLPLTEYFSNTSAPIYPRMMGKSELPHYKKVNFAIKGVNIAELNGFSINDGTGASYVSIPMGLPMSCSGKCNVPGGWDDNKLASTKANDGVASVTGFNAQEKDWARASIYYGFENTAVNGTYYDATITDTLGFVLGSFPCASRLIPDGDPPEDFLPEGPGGLRMTWHGCFDDRKAVGRNAYQFTLSSTQINDIGGRCSTMIEENEFGAFIP